MKANEESRFEKNRKRQHAPDAKREAKAPVKSNCEECDFEPHHQREQTGDADGCENMQQTCANVIARTFRSPGLRRFALIPMKDHTHPKPAGEDRDNTRNQTWKKRSAKCVHRYNGRVDLSITPNSLSIAGSTQIQVSDFGFRIIFHVNATVCLSCP